MFTKTYPKRATRRFLITFGLGALAIAGSLHVAGAAHADPETNFLDEITSQGLEIKQIRGAIGIGYQICAELPTTNGKTVVDQIYYGLPAASPLTYNDIAVILMAAVHNLCPSQYHPERLVPGVS